MRIELSIREINTSLVVRDSLLRGRHVIAAHGPQDEEGHQRNLAAN